MGGRTEVIDEAQARRLLGVADAAAPEEIRRAFRAAAKRLHPDRAQGDAEGFRRVLEAYRLLEAPPAPAPAAGPAPKRPRLSLLDIAPTIALMGGEVEAVALDGRVITLELPAGLRDGERLSAEGADFVVAIQADPEMIVRGHDVWVTVRVSPQTLAQGGRGAVETPFGRRIIWINREAGRRGLVRLVGQGLPARGAHPRGHLFLRLEAEARESVARAMLRRFAAVWAA
jgi:curved DNA-binding protein